MSIVVEKTPVDRAADEFAPMISAATRAALRGVHHAATPLYLEVMSLPDGFAPSDDLLRRRLGWSVTMLRKAKEGLQAAGLYLWENVQVAAGQWTRVCRYVTNAVRGALPQVQPSDPLPTVGQGSQIPPSRERNREGRTDHHPDTCRRDAAGQPCRQCAKARAREERAETPSGATPSVPSGPAPVARVLAAEEPVATPVSMPAELRDMLNRRRTDRVKRARGQ